MERDRESRMKQAEELTSLQEHAPARCTGCLTLLEHQNATAAEPHSHGGSAHPTARPAPPYRAGSRSTRQPPDC